MEKSLTELRDLTEPQRRVLEVVSGDESLVSVFYLTGGTLLKALGIVPRESNDIDLFTFANVDGLKYTQAMSRLRDGLAKKFGEGMLRETDQGFVHVESNMIIDAVHDEIDSIDDFVCYGALKTAGIMDVAANKASAVCSRDEIKDYIDIAFLTKRQGWVLKDLAEMAERKFKLGTISEEKLLTELVAKREQFAVSSVMFLHDGEANARLVDEQVDLLLKEVTI